MQWQDRLKEDLTEYRSVPFWSWNGDLQANALKAQISHMKRIGMGGFFMHARAGLETEYMGPQ